MRSKKEESSAEVPIPEDQTSVTTEEKTISIEDISLDSESPVQLKSEQSEVIPEGSDPDSEGSDEPVLQEEEPLEEGSTKEDAYMESKKEETKMESKKEKTKEEYDCFFLSQFITQLFGSTRPALQ